MKKVLFIAVFWAGLYPFGTAYGAAKDKKVAEKKEAFESVTPGDVVLFFGHPIGLFAETSPYTQGSLRVHKYLYLVHPMTMRLDGPARMLASEESKAELMELPVYELSRYALWEIADEDAE